MGKEVVLFSSEQRLTLTEAVAFLRQLADKLESQKNITIDYEVIKGADHFFSQHMDTLIGHVDNYLDKRLVEAAA